MNNKTTAPAPYLDSIRRGAEFADGGANKLKSLLDTDFDNLTLVEKCVWFFDIKATYTELSEATKRLYAVVDLLDKVLIPAAFEKEGSDKVQIPSLERSFYPVLRYSASIVDKAKGFEYLRQADAADLITETVNAGTLASYLRDRVLEDGIDPPADVFNFRTYHTTGVSKYKPKVT